MDKKDINIIINNKQSIENKLNICEALDHELNQILNISSNNKKTILVLSGGGTKGFAHFGAISAFIELGIMKDFHTIACTSAGGLAGLLYTCGYMPEDSIKLITMLGLDKLRSPDNSDILSDFGFDNGSRFILIFKKLLIAKGFKDNITFRDHYKMTGIKLILTGSCINEKKAYYFSVDTFPDMELLIAIRITISVPFFFTPVVFENKLFSDGGCVDNYPISLFDDQLNNVVGIHLNSKKEIVSKIEHMESFTINTIECLLEGVTFNSCKGYEKYTIKMDINNSSMLNFNIGKDVITEIYNHGYTKILEHYKN